MPKHRRKPPRPSNRRITAPPPVPVVSSGAPKTEPTAPRSDEPRNETDLTEDQIRQTLEAAYT